jgi:hypothetical protein
VFVPRGLREQSELVIHGVPVVITVDQRNVHGWQIRQHVVAQITVKDVPARETLLVLGRVEFGDGIDDVQLGLRAQSLQHQHSGIAAQRADLDDPARARRLQDRPDHGLPERIHLSGILLDGTLYETGSQHAHEPRHERSRGGTLLRCVRCSFTKRRLWSPEP